MRLKKELTWKEVNIYALCFYIITLFVFVYDVELVKISEFAFIVFSAITLTNILRNKKIKFARYFIPVIGLLFIGTLSILWAPDKGLAVTRTITLFQLVILMLLVYQSIDDIEDVKKCMYSMVIGGIGMSVYAIYFYGISEIVNALAHGIRLGGDITQENTFGYLSAITVILLVHLSIHSRKISYFIFSLLPFIFVISSGSRRSLLLVFIGILLSIITHNIAKKKKIRIFVALLIFLLVAPIASQWLLEFEAVHRLTFFINYLKGEGVVDNSLITRNRLIAFGLDLFTRKPIFGYGIHQYRVMHYLNYGVYTASHNGFVNILVEFGLVGFILYYGVFISVINRIWKSFKLNSDYIGSLLAILLLIHIISDIATISFWDKFTYILLSLSAAYYRMVDFRMRLATSKNP